MKKIMYLFLLIVIIFAMTITVNAEEDELSSYELSDIQKFLENDSGYENIDFKEMIEEIMTGTSKNVFRDMAGQVVKNVCSEVIYNKNAMVKIMIMAIISAFFTCFAEAFRTKQITDTGFFITYIIVITILMGSFLVITSVAEEMIRVLLEYMQVLLPAYVLSIGVSVGTSTGTGVYEFMLMLIMAVDYIFLKLLLPAIKIYVILVLINNVLNEDMMSKTTELIKTVITWCTKILIGVILGINVIQGMVLPMADTVKGRGAYKIFSLIPGVGNSVKGMSEILLGSGILIKNAIGVAGMIVIICLASVPIIKMVVFILMYRITSAVIQPVSDKRIIKSISGVYTGAEMLMKIMCTTAIMFILSVVIMCIMTNRIV